MSDSTWTPDVALRILRDALTACIDGRFSPTQLYTWLTTTYATPPGTPTDHLANRLWRQAVLNVAVYLQCDLDRQQLTDALLLLMAGDPAVFTPITRSACFHAMLKNGTAPQPLIALSNEEAYRRQRLMREGFQDI
jgi:hypothetical protein